MQELSNPFSEWEQETEKAEERPAECITTKKEPRLYWLKLKEGFFDSKYIKALRATENGDRMTIVYLAMQLKALKTNGILNYSEIMPSVEEEIALDINENVETVRAALSQLERLGLIEVWDDKSIFMACKRELTDFGSETAAAARMRRSRKKKA